MVGELLGSYRVMDTIGVGGMGVVYLAQHPLIGRKVAIKVLRPELSVNDEIVGRFFNEARASALIKHPGIIDILDFGHRADGSAYIVMEYLEGESLRARLLRVGRLPEAKAVFLARQIAAALAAAHGAGIVHRDLKPDNLHLVRDPEVPGGERVKILDFGVAKLNVEASATVYKTRTGTLMGSPLYMSPEQCRGSGRVDERTDIYSLGCVLFEMVCGRPPFVAEGAGEVISMHLGWAPPAPSSLLPGLSAGLDALVGRLLVKNVADRAQPMAEVARLLEALSIDASGRTSTGTSPGFASGDRPLPPVTTTLGGGAAELKSRPESARRRWLLPAALVLVAGAVVAVVALGRSPSDGEARPVAAPDSAPRAMPAAFDARAVEPAAAAPDARAAAAAARDAGPARTALRPDAGARPGEPAPRPAQKPRPQPRRERGDPVDPFGGTR